LKKWLTALAALSVLIAGAPHVPARPSPAGSGPTGKPRGRPVVAPRATPGELLVAFSGDVERSRARRLLSARDANLGERIEGTDLSIVEIDPRRDPVKAAREYRELAFIEYAEPNLLRSLVQGAKPKPPDDEHFADLWGLDNTGQEHLVTNPPPETAEGTADADIDAPEAWKIETGSAETVIAVIDSGVDVTHPDLVDSLWTNAGEIPGNRIDDDNNGYVDDVHGWDFGDGDATLIETDETVDGYDHGTHVAGTIAAQMNNEIGIAGVCPGCKVMVLKAFKKTDVDRDGTFEMTMNVGDEIEALAYARDMGAVIINGSFAAPSYSKAERLMLEEIDAAGLLTVLAAGNENSDNDLMQFLQVADGHVATSPSWPASYDIPSIISVAASNHRDEYAYDTGCAEQTGQVAPCAFTSWGATSVDLAAPGVDIVSAIPDGGYGLKNGTSMAAPYVSGVAGLVASEHTGYGALEIKNAILSGVDRVPSLSVLKAFGGPAIEGSFTRTNGRLNAVGALAGDPGGIDEPFDGSISGALPIRSQVASDVAWPEDTNDVYKKKLRRGFRYRVKLVGLDGTDLDLIAYKPIAKDIWQYDAFCVGLQPPCGAVLARSISPVDSREQVTFKARAGRTYYFHVAGYFAQSPYTLRITRLPKKKKKR
jgi:subtilisin family serine protease